MPKILDIELEHMKAEILSISGLRQSTLEDAGVELSTDIELHTPYNQAGGGVIDPYDGFLAFAANGGLDYSHEEDLLLRHFSRRQIYLTVAWHFIVIAQYLFGADAAKQGWTRENAYLCGMWHKVAARKLIEDTVGRTNSGAARSLS